jgi:hypothetical protein
LCSARRRGGRGSRCRWREMGGGELRWAVGGEQWSMASRAEWIMCE